MYSSFRILGPLEIELDGRVVIFNRRQERLILGLLLIDTCRPVSVQRIMEFVHPGARPAGARNGIQVLISRLRTALAGSAAIDRVGEAYRIDVAKDTVDLHQFRALVAQSRHEPERAIDLLHQAEALWRGPVLAGSIEDAMDSPVAIGLDDERLTAVEERIDLELAAGAHARLVAELNGITIAYPHRERLICQLALALYRDGRTERALTVIRDERNSLSESLGVDPGPQMRDLEIAILRHDARLQLIFTPGEVVPQQLPSVGRGFTGRRRDMARLDATLAATRDDGSRSIIVMTGMAGVGKTSLALRWTAGLVDRYPHGQMYLDLRGHRAQDRLSTAEALAHLLTSLGVAANEIPADGLTATTLLHTRIGSQRLLLVLDNAGSIDQIRPLLPSGDSCLVIVTSRHAMPELEVHFGAIRVRLDPMCSADAVELLGSLVVGVTTVQRSQELAEVAHRCAYLPLALRIAGTRLQDGLVHGTRWYLDELAGAHRLDALELPGDSSVAVRGAFALSYRNLPTELRETFSYLALIPGPDFGAEAAAALIDRSVSAVGLNLRALVSAHLLELRRPGRFAFHDLIGEYASELALTVPDRQSACRRLYRWYLTGALHAARLLYGGTVRLPDVVDRSAPSSFDDEHQARRWIDNEHVSLIAAVRVGAAMRQADYATRIGDALRGYLLRHGSLQTWLSVANAAMDAAQATTDIAGQAAAQLSIAVAYGRSGQLDRTETYLRRSADLAALSNWTECQSACLANLGQVYWRTGHLSQAAAVLISALDQNSPAVVLRNARNNLALVRIDQGRYAEAMALVESLTGTGRTLGNPFGRAELLDTTAAIHQRMGCLDEALHCHEQALRIYGELHHHDMVACATAAIAELACKLGQRERARDLLARIQRHAGTTGYPMVGLSLLQARATLAQLDGDAAGAVNYAEQAYHGARESNYRHNEAEATARLAGAYAILGAADDSARYRRLTLEIIDECGYDSVPLLAMSAVPRHHGRAGLNITDR